MSETIRLTAALLQEHQALGMLLEQVRSDESEQPRLGTRATPAKVLYEMVRHLKREQVFLLPLLARVGEETTADEEDLEHARGLIEALEQAGREVGTGTDHAQVNDAAEHLLDHLREHDHRQQHLFENGPVADADALDELYGNNASLAMQRFGSAGHPTAIADELTTYKWPTEGFVTRASDLLQSLYGPRAAALEEA